MYNAGGDTNNNENMKELETDINSAKKYRDIREARK